jgi:WD40 repeat protein
VWDLQTGEEISRLSLPTVPVSCVRWSRGSDRLAVSFGRWSDPDQASLAIWSPEEHLIVLEEPLSFPAGALDWLDEDQRLIIAGWDGQAQVWSIAQSGPMWGVQLEKNDVSAAAWSPDCPLGRGLPAPPIGP